MDIDQTEDKGGESETAETERRGIGELTEQAFMGFRVKVLSGRREDGRLVSLGVSTGISGFAAVIVEVVVGLEIAGAIVLITGNGRHCGSEIEPSTIISEELEENKFVWDVFYLRVAVKCISEINGCVGVSCVFIFWEKDVGVGP